MLILTASWIKGPEKFENQFWQMFVPNFKIINKFLYVNAKYIPIVVDPSQNLIDRWVTIPSS